MSPGSDGIPGFRRKRLFQLLYHYFHMFLLGDVALPVWFPVGRTLLLPKKHHLINSELPCYHMLSITGGVDKLLNFIDVAP